MGPGWCDDGDTARLQYCGGSIDRVAVRNDKPDVVEALPRPVALGRRLMQGQVVTTRGEVGIVRVGLPDDPHPKQGCVKLDRNGNIRHIQGDMSQAGMGNFCLRRYGCPSYRRDMRIVTNLVCVE